MKLIALCLLALGTLGALGTLFECGVDHGLLLGLRCNHRDHGQLGVGLDLHALGQYKVRNVQRLAQIERAAQRPW